MTNEWLLVIAICTVPFAMFALFEWGLWLKRRKDRAIARRPKGLATNRRDDHAT